MTRSFGTALGLLAAAGLAPADEPPTAPRPVPLTRPEMKQLLEDMKARTPRIPLPEPTAEEKEQLGERATNYEARLRYHYMPWTRGEAGRGGGGGGGGFGKDDPNATLTYKFKTQLFWIVSRTNNCHY